MSSSQLYTRDGFFKKILDELSTESSKKILAQLFYWLTSLGHVGITMYVKAIRKVHLTKLVLYWSSDPRYLFTNGPYIFIPLPNRIRLARKIKQDVQREHESLERFCKLLKTVSMMNHFAFLHSSSACATQNGSLSLGIGILQKLSIDQHLTLTCRFPMDRFFRNLVEVPLLSVPLSGGDVPAAEVVAAQSRPPNILMASTMRGPWQSLS